MSARAKLIEAQRAWAQSIGLEPDEKGYLPSCEQNLFRRMNAKTKLAFENGDGKELEDSAKGPAKMRALHSSSALVVNFFDAWVDRDARSLVSALGLESSSDVEIGFEEQFPTGLPGNPPNLDVVLAFADETVAIESKFTEWLTPKSSKGSPFKDKYFPSGVGVWARVGLTRSQELAEAIRAGTEVFRHLDAPQLLKHALGLATRLCDRFRLFYVYYDCVGDESATHKSEIERFSQRVGTEFGFRALTYQEVFWALCRDETGASEYRRYLRSRYFGASPLPIN